MNGPADTELQTLVDRLNAGDPMARNELISRSCDRLRRLTAKMLRDFGGVHRWEDTDDVLQNALLRLLKELDKTQPESARHFFFLATRQIRHQLVELARHYYGPQGLGANYESHEARSRTDSVRLSALGANTRDQDAAQIAIWREIQEKVETLPEHEREVFDLIWYQGMTKAQAAQVLNISEPAVKGRWLAARTRLGSYLRKDLSS